MDINGVRYVKEEKLASIQSDLEKLRKENQKMMELLKILLPIGEEEINHFFVHHGASYLMYICKDGYFGNERLEYEMKIKNLTQEVAGLKSQITKIKKSYKENEDGSIALSKSDITKLKQINKLIEGILQE